MSPFHAKNLNPLLPKEGIAKKMLPHADLILPRPWNQMEMMDWGFRALGWGRAREGRAEHGVRLRKLVREGVRFT